ncbi:hypothetical protein FOMPIDRAFT_114657 [Fomitopsis schrenkii]|uniref:Uncharacterized protein n=1 Tax=Fomitopsis schrenkii TaxID=2126942 RepID=S8E7J0_FOMSC|nr:hypothetical protein FOMPIDRAFT_114657 [Fomitopsis schrenkii]
MARFTLFVMIFSFVMPILTASTAKCALGKRSGTTAAVAARACEPDGEDGSGGCHPCDGKCETNKRSLEEDLAIRTIHGNATVPWEQGETVRWHILGPRQNSNPQLLFNCPRMRGVCARTFQVP